MTLKETNRMKTRTLALAAAVAASCALSAACGEPSGPAGAANSNAGAAAPKNDSVKVGPKVVRDEAGPDGSHITVRQLENGDQVTVRKFASGPLAKVTRREKGGQAKAVRVVYKNDRVVRIEDREAIDHMLDWTAAQIDDAAKKSGKVVSDAPARGQKGADEDDDAE
jgi:hypothetical protein